MNIYAMLAPFASPQDAHAFTDAVFLNGGSLVIFMEPRLALVDGDDTTVSALQALVGSELTAVGVEDVNSLLLEADTWELAGQIGALASTTAVAEQAAELLRPAAGESWAGLGCVAGEEA